MTETAQECSRSRRRVPRVDENSVPVAGRLETRSAVHMNRGDCEVRQAGGPDDLGLIAHAGEVVES